MKTVLIQDSDFATMWYHSDKKILHHQFHKFAHGEALRSFLMKGNETLRKNKANKWLSDDRNNPVLANDDQEWGKTVWVPQALFAGWKYWAIVQSKHSLAQMTMEDAVRDLSKAGLVAKFFSDPDEAMQWLESQPD